MLCEKEIHESSFIRFRVFVGIYTLSAMCSVYNLWGNLSVYVISYLYIRVNEDDELNTSWVTALNSSGGGIGMLICHKLTQICGMRAVMIYGNLVFCISVVSSYFTINYSYMALAFTFGMGTGIGYGTIHGLASIYVIIWTKRYVVMATGFLLSVELIGSVASNLLITWYINPDNVKADLIVTREHKYFSQKQLLDKVPKVFIIYGIIAFVFALVSFCLIKDKPTVNFYDNQNNATIRKGHGVYQATGDSRVKQQKETIKIEKEAEVKEHKTRYGSCLNDEQHSYKSMESSFISKNQEQSSDNSQLLKTASILGNQSIDGENINRSQLVGVYDDHVILSNSYEKSHVENTINMSTMQSYLSSVPNPLPRVTDDLARHKSLDKTSFTTENNRLDIKISKSEAIVKTGDEPGSNDFSKDIQNSENKDSETLEDVNLRQALKSRTFYILLTMIASADISLLVLLTYYKSFGMFFYSDDHFLSSVSLLLNIAMTASVNVTGIASERLDLKNTVLFTYSIVCFMSSFFYVSALVDKWLYLAWVTLYGSWLYAVYTIFCAGILKYFGKTHSTTIVGMALSFSYVSDIAASIIIQYVVQTYGWLMLFSLVATLNVIGFILIVFGLPDKTRY